MQAYSAPFKHTGHLPSMQGAIQTCRAPLMLAYKASSKHTAHHLSMQGAIQTCRASSKHADLRRAGDVWDFNSLGVTCSFFARNSYDFRHKQNLYHLKAACLECVIEGLFPYSTPPNLGVISLNSLKSQHLERHKSKSFGFRTAMHLL